MGKTFSEVMAAARSIGSNARVPVTVVTNQDNRMVSYATGVLQYFPGRLVGPVFRSERLSTSGAEPLNYLFSDRTVDLIAGTPDPGPFIHIPELQPFSVRAADKLGMSIGSLFGGIGNTPTIKFTLVSWGNATFNVATTQTEHLLVGIGNPIGNATTNAVYLISFGEPFSVI